MKTEEWEMLLTEDKIRARINELGREITRDFAGQKLYMIWIMRGGGLVWCLSVTGHKTTNDRG